MMTLNGIQNLFSLWIKINNKTGTLKVCDNTCFFFLEGTCETMKQITEDQDQTREI